MAWKLPEYIIVCLLCTIIIELLGAFYLRVKDKKDYVNIIWVNVITNSIVVVVPYVLYLYVGIIYRNISLEVLAVILEGYIYKKVLNYGRFNVYLLSLILNLCSYFIGNVIGNFIF